MAVDGSASRLNRGKEPLELLPWSAIKIYFPKNLQGYPSYYGRRLGAWFHHGYSDTALKGILNELEKYKDAGPVSIAKVLEEGKKKYGERNWEKGMKWSVCYASALRHCKRLMEGQELDVETGYSHYWHIACNVMFLLEYSTTCPELDDRPCKQKEEEAYEKPPESYL